MALCKDVSKQSFLRIRKSSYGLILNISDILVCQSIIHFLYFMIEIVHCLQDNNFGFVLLLQKFISDLS